MSKVSELLGDKAEYLLGFNTPKISKERLHLPGPDWVGRMFINSDRNNRVLGNLAWMYQHGRLAGTGYLSILRSIRALSTRRARHSRRIPTTSIRRTS